MTKKDYTQAEANQFIIECHTDLEAVQQKVAAKPGLVHAYNPETIESALGAAGHMGQRAIAEFLLDHGAEPELATLAMLGRYNQVAAWLAKDPEAAKSGGAHRIPVAFHAAISGDIGLLQLLWEAGAQEQVKNALLGAVAFNRPKAARWLIAHGANQEQKSPNGKTPLEVAQERGYTEIAELLAAAGK